jgi:hypothetical protein
VHRTPRRCALRDLPEAAAVKPRQSSLLELMGLRDPDLAAPAHDRMCVWLAAHAEQVVSQEPRLTWGCELIRVSRVDLEVPVMRGNHIVGFLDVVVRCVVKPKPDDPREWVGWGPDGAALRVGIEVKSRVDSMGALLRQISVYRQYFEGPVGVMAPENGALRDVLRGQRIPFVAAPELSP